MRVAVIVQNTVYKDSRVRKECSSLQKNGFNLIVFGYGSKEKKDVFVENFKVILIEKVGLRFTNFALQLFRKVNQNNNKSENKKIFKTKLPYIKKSIFHLAVEKLGIFFSKIYKKIISSLVSAIGIYFRWPLISNIIFKEIQKYKFDVIHAHDMIALIVAIKYKKIYTETKIIWDAHEIYTHMSNKSALERIYVNKLIQNYSSLIDVFITINQSIADFYNQKYKKLSKAYVIMNATRKVESLKNEEKIRIKCKLKNNQKILLFQGVLTKNRGIEELLIAAKYLDKNWSIVFMGWGPLENLIKERMKELNATRLEENKVLNLIPPAPYEELVNWTKDADLGIIFYKNSNLNHSYCTPNKLWEYPNANVPILCSDLIEIKKIVEKHNIGFILKESSTGREIAEFINNLKKEKLNIFSRNCLQFKELENWGNQETKLIKIYKNLKKIIIL